MTFKQNFQPILVIFVVSSLFLFFFYSFTKSAYLAFSDSAKYADLARNMVQENGYGLNFSFWGGKISDLSQAGLFETSILPMHPLIVASSFKLFGINDISVVLVTMVFYLLSALLIYLIGSKFFGRLTRFLSAIAFAATPDVLNYAVSGGTEMTFFFEILLSIYLFSAKTRIKNILALLILVAMYFTRPQAFIFISGIILFGLLLNYETKKAIKYFVGVLFSGALLDNVILQNLPSWTHFYSILSTGSFVTSYVGSNQASSDILRGVKDVQSYTDLIKRVFYNLYNFYKLAPQILNPYLLALFVIGLFRLYVNKTANAFKWASLFMIGVTLLVTAASIPLFRYIHPVVPLIYLLATENLIFLVERIYNYQFSIYKQITISNLQITKRNFVIGISSFLVFIFVIGQTLGVIFLDSRFERKTHNVNKPPIYVEMSKELKNITSHEDIIVTNLDTWGSWYGERKTVWFPIDPSHLNTEDEMGQFDAIYLTNYLMDDDNYRMGKSWKQIFENPTDIKDEYIKENYEFYKEYLFPASENYEKMEGRGILLRRKI